jgi:hypothetical protein
MFEAAARAVPLIFLSAIVGSTQQPSASAPSQKTLFVMCQDDRPQHVLSPVSSSQDQTLRAYVEVDIRSGCLQTSRLWIGSTGEGYRVTYLIAPRPLAMGNGMEILGWSSDLLLVRTEQWQYGSDAEDTQGVIAIHPATGMVYEPNLEAIPQAHKGKRCSYRVLDAGFAAGTEMTILVRARLSTAIEPPDTEEDVPEAERCGNAEETWSFNLHTGETKQVANTVPLQLFRN